MKICIVGVGALGSHLALFLRNLVEPSGVRPQVCLIDFDRVEERNLASQVHSVLGLRQNKAQAMRQLLHGMFKAGCLAVPHKLTADNAAQLLGCSALVVDCTDNAEARELIKRYCQEQAIPCLHGALAADGTMGRVVWSHVFTADPESALGQPTCEDGAALPLYALVSAQLAIAVQDFLGEGARRSYHITRTGVLRLE